MAGKMNKKTIEASKDNTSFHVIHKIPHGDSPYAMAKYAQMVEKDSEKAIVWFWKAINCRDRVDSALKDMAVVMKQLNKEEEAIEAIMSFRNQCPQNSQYSLDNVLIDLYKKCGNSEKQIELLKRQLRMIYKEEAFYGKTTKTARSHGKKFKVTVLEEITRLLGKLGWAYMQQSNYKLAEAVYRKALTLDPDANRSCNLGLCLLKQNRFDEAIRLLHDVLVNGVPGSDDYRTQNRAQELLTEIEAIKDCQKQRLGVLGVDDDFICGLKQMICDWIPVRSKRLPIFEEISSHRDHLAC